ncbi:hypothetical protein Poli38472_006475 [Pythium oligandrum]|uniref:Formiminoglutamate deiminase n=1 Tax=Pythium oligandrum TaxID=41045 RepID=A0A8K1C4Z1_PYTOL|nr:hypothetical protein Poli38472_006475 [Pythium oligandrum]|eukprot:TMW56465.1 hypothetical protein Poli38472_006475 [Pythium oligandrum]
MTIMERLTKAAGAAYAVEAELTWTGERFERDVQVHVGADGCIVDVTTGAKTKDTIVLSGHALVPGMVNAHSHAFQRGLRGLGETYPKTDASGNKPQSSFWTWRDEMYKLVERMTDEQIYALTKQCFSEMLDAGITSVGEFHYFHHGEGAEKRFAYDEKILQAARDVGIRVVLLNAFYEHGGFNKAPMSTPQLRFKTPSLEEYWTQMDALKSKLTSTQSLGVVAHSMRAVDLEDMNKLHQESVKRGLVFHMHLEEQTKEVEDCKEANGGKTPMALLLENLKVDNKFTAVHCTWTEPEQLKEYVARGGNVCICPLTEGNLGDGFPAIASCGTSICLGTDCNARIDMCEEMRWLEYAHRLNQSRRGVCTDAIAETDLPKLLFQYATTNGAKSLNLPVGEIKSGLGADFALIDINDEQLKFSTPESLLGAFIFGANGSSVVTATCVDGKWRKTTQRAPQTTSEATEEESPEYLAQVQVAAGLADANSDDVVKLTCGLMNVSSTSGDELAVGKLLERWLSERGWKVERQKVPPQSDSPVKVDRYNIYASRTGNKAPALLFNSHMDTVPPFLPARTDGQKIYGRGSCDAKSLIAAQMIAAQKLVESGYENDVSVLYVVSEETDHSGMKKANELGLTPSHLIVGEPTKLKMIKLQKGILKVRLTRKGIAAHSGYPHLGDSAIDPLIDVLYDLKHEKWPSSEELGATTLNIGIISGGQAANALAEHASAMLMFRLTTNPDEILDRVNSIVNGRVDVELYTSNAPVHLSVVDGYDTDVASFNTDIPYFKFDGKAYLVGAGSITDAHCSREYIDIADLETLVDFYFNLGKKLISASK